MKKHFITGVSLLALTLAGQAYANESSIDQIGGLNEATIDQTGGNEGVSTVDQIGSAHIANVTQSDDPNNGTPGFNTASNTSTIYQDGEQAKATVNQTGDPGEAPGNISEITQWNDGPPSAEADVMQNGANNFSSVVQGRDTDPLDRRGQYASVTQDGTDHISTIEQKGNLNTANVTQATTGNSSDISQSGAENDATVAQTGAGNISTISQSANFGMTSVEQSGDNNTSDVTQSGRANSSIAALILQDGNGNTSSVLQTSLISGPGSADQFAEVTQSSDNNSSIIEQDGGDPVVDTVNTGNSASVFQMATNGNVSSVMQSGAGNTATVNQ